MKRGLFLGTAALFALAMLAGGLGPHAPLAEAAIEAAAFVLLAALVASGQPTAARPAAVAPLLLVLLFLALGVAQLVPLPAALWQALPNRFIPAAILKDIGQPNRSWPLSLSPVDTRLVLQALLPPVAVFVATLVASTGQRRQLAALVVAAAGASALLGLIQLSFGDGTLFPYPVPPFSRIPGVFANFNHQALFLAAAVALLPAVAGRTQPRAGLVRAWPLAAGALLLLGGLITSSRAGLALCAVAAIVTAIRLWARPRVGSSRLPWIAGALLVAAAAVLLVALPESAGLGYRGELMSSRLEAADADARFGIWAAAWQLVTTYFPFGSGLGTFEAVYQVAEPLDAVQRFVINHAHDDYLELAIETGAAGVMLLLLFVIWFASRVVRLARGVAGDAAPAWSGVLVIALIMLHSLVDYPLRTEALGCVFAFACGLLVDAPAVRGRVRAARS